MGKNWASLATTIIFTGGVISGYGIGIENMGVWIGGLIVLMGGLLLTE